MIILHVVAPADVGGLERVVHALAIGQHDAGHHVHVAAVVEGDVAANAFLGPLRAAGVTTHAVSSAGRAYWRERAAVAQLCRTLAPDIVHTHGYRPDVVAAGAARRLGIPTVTTVHGFTGGDWKNRVYEWMQRRALRRFAAVVAVSQPMAQRLGAIPPGRLDIVPNAWHQAVAPLGRDAARRELGVGGDVFHVGWVGRVSREKGPDVLIDALVRLGDGPWRASVLGDGPERGRLEARATVAGVASRMAWRGATPDAGRLFAAFDVFVLSSRTEGTPIVLFEAMAAGAPIVAARVGGVADVVSDAEALLVPPEDGGALAAAVRAVWSDPGAARARAARARTRLTERFAWRPWVDRYVAIYQRVRR